MPTPNLLLTIWESLSDRFSHTELQNNWNSIDAHDHTGAGKGLLIPPGALEPAAVLNVNLATEAVDSNVIKAGAITNVAVSGAAAIAEGKLALASDAAAGVASRRTLGITALSACSGADSRLPTQAEKDALTATLTGIAVPTGAIMPYGGITAPAGWLLCQGQTDLTKTDPLYINLFAVIGNGFAAGSTTFGVPDLRGRLPLGAGTPIQGAYGATAHARGQLGGNEKVRLTAAQSGSPAHTHPAPSAGKFLTTLGGTSTTANGSGGFTTNTNTGSSLATGATVDHDNMPPFVSLNYIIKL